MLEPYSDTYIESCFQLWYRLGCPAFKDLHEKIEPDEHDRIPHVSIVTRWAREREWNSRRDEIQGRAAIVTENELVNETVAMWRQHALNAKVIGDLAVTYLQEHGFDTATSALAGVKWAQEEERRTRGAEAFLESVRNSSPDELIRKIRRMAARGFVDTDSIDAEISQAENSGSIENREDKEGDAESSNP